MSKHEDHLRELIRNTETRFIEYKKMLEGLFKDRVSFPAEDEFVGWYKDFLRDMKNLEEGSLKVLQIEMRHHREGMNPPYCYSEYRNDATRDDRSDKK